MIITVNVLTKIFPVESIFYGNKKLIFHGVSSILESTEKDLSWIKQGVKNELELVQQTKSKGIILTEQTYTKSKIEGNDKLFIIHPRPELLMQKLLKFIVAQSEKNKGINIHPTAIVDSNCKLGENVVIGAYCIIGACKIGNNVKISNHVKIFDPVEIGDDCVIREFCSIGGEGFGFVKNEYGINEHIPHIGSLIIEKNVIVFPFSNIDRGTLGKTIVKRNTAIDHYVHVGHNSEVGENNLITAGVTIAGGVRINNNCFIGVNTSIKEKVVVHSNVITGMGSVVTKNIPKDEVWIGNPAKLLKINK